MCPNRNLSTRRVHEGVLVDAPCSGYGGPAGRGHRFPPKAAGVGGDSPRGGKSHEGCASSCRREPHQRGQTNSSFHFRQGLPHFLPAFLPVFVFLPALLPMSKSRVLLYFCVFVFFADCSRKKGVKLIDTVPPRVHTEQLPGAAVVSSFAISGSRSSE